MTYVDGFLIPIPKKNLAAYRKQAKLGAKLWMEHGALDYMECVADDLVVDDMQGNKVKPFVDLTKLKEDETLAFSWILYKSKAHRNAVNKRVMKDPRMLKGMQEPMPFDMARFCYGGFKPIVTAPKGKAAAKPAANRATRRPAKTKQAAKARRGKRAASAAR